MPKPKTSTQHRCPIHQNCRPRSILGAKAKMKMCNKHQDTCTVHELIHLKSEPCKQCEIDSKPRTTPPAARAKLYWTGTLSERFENGHTDRFSWDTQQLDLMKGIFDYETT